MTFSTIDALAADEVVTAFTLCMWGTAFLVPLIVALASNTRRLAANWSNSTAAPTWIVLYILALAAGCMASVGIALAHVTYTTLYINWTAAIICAMLYPLPKLVWALTSRPDSKVSSWDVLVGLVPALTLSTSTLVFLALAHSVDGTLANYIPMGLWLPLPLVDLLMVVVRILEQCNTISVSPLKKNA
jgi:hypothetical protein